MFFSVAVELDFRVSVKQARFLLLVPYYQITLPEIKITTSIW